MDIHIDIDARKALEGIDRIANASHRIDILRSAVNQAVGPVIGRAASIVQQPGKSEYWPRYGQRKKRKHLRDTIGHALRIYSSKLVGVIGPLYPAGASGHLVESGHRMAVGGSLVRQAVSKVRYHKDGTVHRPNPRRRFFFTHTPNAKRGVRGGGRVVGMTRAYPFMKPAFESTQEVATDIMLKALAEHITQAVSAAGGLANG